jgi:hypothetical protein
MKKMIGLGFLAAALIVGGGTGAYIAHAKDNTVNSGQYFQGSNMENMMKQVTSNDFKDMQQFMQNGNVDFDQMKPFMKKMHPELSDQQLEDLFKSMHSKGGACDIQEGQSMMGNNL